MNNFEVFAQRGSLKKTGLNWPENIGLPFVFVVHKIILLKEKSIIYKSLLICYILNDI